MIDDSTQIAKFTGVVGHLVILLSYGFKFILCKNQNLQIFRDKLFKTKVEGQTTIYTLLLV